MTPEIVLGPPGTGKTTTLLGMVDEEIAKGTEPEHIGYVSFTRKAAHEAAERACKRFDLKPARLPYFRTLHSLCFQALGLNSADVLEGQQLVEFGDWIGVRVSGKVSFEEGSTFGFEVGDRCLHMENIARVKGVGLREQYDQDHDNLSWMVVERVAKGLAEWKRAKRVYDYTDMLQMFAESDWRAPLEVLFVDEAQDLSMLQWRVVWKLAQTCRRVVIAGDDDQAIYRWAGAAVDYFVGMPGRVRVLDQSWRVPEAVRALADEAISAVQNRRPKVWAPKKDTPGQVVRVSSIDELDFAADEDVLVLARNACFLRDDTMPLLRSRGVLYEFRHAPSVRASVIEAILTWERLRKGEPVDVQEVQKVYDLLSSQKGVARGYKKIKDKLPGDELVTLADLRERGGLLTDAIWHEALDGIRTDERVYMVAALRNGMKLTKRPSLRLSTIHGAKGGEADHVVLYRDMAFRTFEESRRLPEDEARVWYVAATRARKRLTIVAPQTRRAFTL